MCKWILFLGCLWLCTVSAADDLRSAGSLNAKLQAVVPEYSVTGETFLAALLRVADEFHIPLGVEWIASPSAAETLSLTWHDTSVRNILEAIVASQPGYELHVDSEILHVTSTAVPHDQNFLNLKIHSFETQKQVVQMAERKLTSAILATVSPQKAGGMLGSLGTSPNEPTISIRRDDASVSQILDSLVTVSRKKIWVVTFTDSFILTAAGFRQTRSLWSNASVPDTEQPLWDMFSWDEALPPALKAD